MIRLKVAKIFADKETCKTYKVGEMISLPDERAMIAIERGFAEKIADKVEAKVEAETEAKPKRKSAKKKKG